MSKPTSRALRAQKHLIAALATVAALELLRSVILVWVVLVSVLAPDVVLVVHMAGILLGLMMSTLAVVSVHALGLSELVNFTTDESSEELLGESVVHDIALFALVVLVELEALEGGTASHELVGEFSLVVWIVVAAALVVDLVVRVLRFTPAKNHDC